MYRNHNFSVLELRDYFFRSVTGTIAPLYSNFQPVRYLSEASELLGDVAHHCCINRLFNQSLRTYQPITANYLCLSRKMNSGRTFYLPTNHRPTASILRLSEWKLDQREGLTIRYEYVIAQCDLECSLIYDTALSIY